MAATELTSETTHEIELTATPLTSDQCEPLPVSSPTHSHSPSCNPPATPPSHDSGPQTSEETTGTEKECEAILDASCTPQACQQIEIVTEELSSEVPRIDAAWSIGREHSYEQKPGKIRGDPDSSFDPNKPDNTGQLAGQKKPHNTDPDCDKENLAHSAEQHHAPKLFQKEQKGSPF